MSQANKVKGSIRKASDIVAYSGGKVVGRTKLQKIGCLLCLAGLEDGFDFEYKHYGPYSEELSSSIHDATILGLIAEEEKPASWGGTYSIYTLAVESKAQTQDSKTALAALANEADSVVLELAVTAAFLGMKGERDPWGETRSRKPEKANEGRLAEAKDLYSRIRKIDVPNALPEI